MGGQDCLCVSGVKYQAHIFLLICRFDKSLCFYEFDKLDKPKEAFHRIRKCHTSAIVSMAYDHKSNTVLTGSIDGSMKVWSVEGR